jgi:predicted permease
MARRDDSADVGPPALARWLIGRRYRGDAREVVEGDLAEVHQRALDGGASRRAASRLYWRLTLASLAAPRIGSMLGEPARDSVSSKRDRGSASGLHGVAADARLGVRRLLHSPGFFLPAVLTLGLTIGANAAMFGVLERLVLSPLPFADADRLVYLWRSNAEGSMMLTPRAADLARWQTLDHIFEQLSTFESRSFVVTGGGEPEEVAASAVPRDLFPMLGMVPALGRTFGPADLDPAAPPTVVLSDQIWRSRFGGDPAVIGREMRLDDQAFLVIGVMPRAFVLPMSTAVVWVPLQRPGGRGGNTIAKLRKGLAVDAAQAALAAAGPVESPTGGTWVGRVMAPSDMVGVNIQTTVKMLAGAVALLLLLASVNVANLVVSRNRTRHLELAVRAALGASRKRLMRLLLTETALVVVVSGGVGVLVATWGLAVIKALRPNELRVFDSAGLGGPVLWYTLAVTTGVACIVGVLPALRASRGSMRSALSAGGRTMTVGGHVARGLVGAVQIGAALMLVIGALLLTRSLANLTAISPGFDVENVVSLDLPLPAARYPTPEARRRFFDDVLSRTRDLAGVESAAVTTGVPPSTGIMFGVLEIEGAPPISSEPTMLAGGSVSPGYFSALRIPLAAGREFSEEDVATNGVVTIVSESFARKYLPADGAVGSRLRMDPESQFATVVGVVADVRANGLSESPVNALHIYVPFRSSSSALLVVRSTGGPLATIDAVKAGIWALDPDLAIREVVTARDRLRQATATPRFGLVLLGAFATIGLAMAAVGVFGVLMLIVGLRRREMAVRLSLGATRAQVIGQVGRYAAWVTALGVALGLAGAVALSRYISSLLTGVTPSDPATMVAAVVTVVVAAGLAAIVPARRLATVEPIEALRLE